MICPSVNLLLRIVRLLVDGLSYQLRDHAGLRSRKAAERTVQGLWSAIGRIVDLFTQANGQPLQRLRLRSRLMGFRSRRHPATACTTPHFPLFTGGADDLRPLMRIHFLGWSRDRRVCFQCAHRG